MQKACRRKLNWLLSTIDVAKERKTTDLLAVMNLTVQQINSIISQRSGRNYHYL